MDTTYTPGAEDAISAVLGLIFMVIGIAIMLAIAAVIAYLFLMNIKRVPAEHRKMEPNKIWLLLIPIFNLYWNFVVTKALSQSYRSYFNAQGDDTVGDCGEQMGLFYSIAAACSLIGIIPFIGCIAPLFSIAALVLLIIYLVKLFELRGRIPENGGYGGGPTGPMDPPTASIS